MLELLFVGAKVEEPSNLDDIDKGTMLGAAGGNLILSKQNRFESASMCMELFVWLPGCAGWGRSG